MKSIRQLLRQPIKTMAGILLTAIAVAVLCVSFSQTLAARDTSKQLLETYMTVALPTNKLQSQQIAWVNSFIEEHPELVKQSIRQGFASAYIPSLTPDNYTQHRIADRNTTDRTNELLQPDSLSYGGAILEIDLISVVPVGVEPEENGTEDSMTFLLEGKILRAIRLQNGYYDPTNYTIKIFLSVSSQAEFDALALQAGSRYLVCGNGYYDLDWELRDYLAEIMVWRREESLPEWDMETFTKIEGYHGNAKYKCKIGDLFHGLSAWEMEMFRTVTLTVDGAAVTMPTIAQLDGTVEEFLQSSAGDKWQAAIADMEINCHSFPIIGTENLQGVAAFSLGRAKISEGREFSDEEIQAGAKVCVISDSLALAHGLQIGDTIDLQYFTYGLDNPYQQYIHDGKGIVNPAPYTYYANSVGLGEAENYEIVGIYKQNTPWGSVEDDLYAFTPNTIFVPQASVTGTMDFASAGQFLTLVLHSDKLLETQLYVIDADQDELFEYYDGGYNAVASSLAEYQAAANRILPIGIVVYTIVMVLYLFLFPAREERALAQMDSLGAGHGKQVRHVICNVLGILIPGSILGTVAAVNMWEMVAAALREWMETDVAVQLNTNWLWLVAAVQALVVTAGAAFLGLVMSRRVNPMQKR